MALPPTSPPLLFPQRADYLLKAYIALNKTLRIVDGCEDVDEFCVAARDQIDALLKKHLALLDLGRPAEQTDSLMDALHGVEDAMCAFPDDHEDKRALYVAKEAIRTALCRESS